MNKGFSIGFALFEVTSWLLLAGRTPLAEDKLRHHFIASSVVA
jgi:hypothetical protein